MLIPGQFLSLGPCWHRYVFVPSLKFLEIGGTGSSGAVFAQFYR